MHRHVQHTRDGDTHVRAKILTRFVMTNLLEYRWYSGQLYGKSEIVSHRETSYGYLYSHRARV